MIRLDLSTGPKWLDLGHGLRLHVLPVSTAIMVAARNDPAVEALPEGASKEEQALVMAKAVARRVVTGYCDTLRDLAGQDRGRLEAMAEGVPF